MISLLVALFILGEDLLPEEILPFSPKHYICYRTDAPLVIDGRLDEDAWQEAEWTDCFVDIEGPAKPKPRFNTRAKMLWDDGYFYIAAELDEPDLWATLTERDSVIFHDHDFEVFIDPDGDTHHYYEFEMNALNTVWDLFLDKPYRDGCKPLFFWDIRGLKSAVRLGGTLNDAGDEDKGWTVELAFPWLVLKECAHQNRPPENGEQWRVNFSRVEWRTKVEDGRYTKVIDPKTGRPHPEDNWVWSPQGRINMHMPERWGFVQFSGKSAGSGKDEFVHLLSEEAKWALRRIYYRQRRYKEKTGRFTDDIAELGLEDPKVAGYRWPPKIEHTGNLFEATLLSADGRAGWHITQDGRVSKK